MTPHMVGALLLGLGLLSCGPSSAQVCTREYAPLCGQVAGQAAPQTFANRCLLNAAQANLLSTGPCPQTAQMAPPMTGNDEDVHGCKASTGHVWHAELASCVRPWMSSAVTLQVAAQRRPCTGVVNAQCLQVRELAPKKKKWTTLHGSIDGFEPEPGVRYSLRVRKDRLDNPPADAPNLKYTLLKVIQR